MAITPFKVNVGQSTLDDLHQRLAGTRWTGEISGTGWDHGTNLEYLKSLVRFWQEDFDWPAQERAINRFAHFRTDIDGIGIHFIHERAGGRRSFVPCGPWTRRTSGTKRDRIRPARGPSQQQAHLPSNPRVRP